MEKSGSRTPYPEVINEKGLRSWKRACIETGITLGFWGLILYLFAIVITFCLWYFGFHLAYYEFYVVGFYEMQRLFANAITVSVVVMALSLLWSYYNVFLIKIKGERRRSQVSISFDEDMAKLFHIAPDMLRKVKDCQVINVSFKQDEIIFKVINLSATQGT
jgi:poly-beta-1,6-N-acetyl-D-glucosamine biosynthesis protein PgaD